jgi:hypothetical protein
MSSPIHHAEDLDAALVYAPPWAREQSPPLAGAPPAPPSRGSLRINQVSNVRQEYSGDRAMVELQRKLKLHPNWLPEPPSEGAASLWAIALRLFAVAGAAALVALGIVSLTATRQTVSETARADVLPPPVPVNRVKVVHMQYGNATPGVEERLAKQSEALPPAPAPTPPVAMPPVAAPASAVPPPPTPSPPAIPRLALGDDEITTLVNRGKDYLSNGDLASARLLLRRAAEAGSAEGALALGASFDPAVIQRLGAIGAEPDIARAREWYQKAVELGSNAASQQLARLVQARQ